MTCKYDPLRVDAQGNLLPSALLDDIKKYLAGDEINTADHLLQKCVVVFKKLIPSDEEESPHGA